VTNASAEPGEQDDPNAPVARRGRPAYGAGRRLPILPAEKLAAVIESILFVADEAVDTGVLAKVLRKGKTEVENALRAIEERCEGSGTRLQRTGDLVQLVTAPESGPYVERFLGFESRQRLSSAALESLAVVAYKQPVTRASVEAVRGVNSDAAIASLIGRGLVEEVGKAPGPGRPALLGTTLRFLEHFGLKNPGDLPPLPLNGDTPPDDGAEDDEAATETSNEGDGNAAS
jgi:segregation and condensation protein B